MDEKVAAHFLLIIPLFPTPETITFPFLQLIIALIICSKETPIDDLNFLMLSFLADKSTLHPW